MAKQAYFSTIKRAKNSYWKTFLAGADHKSVRKARRLVLGRLLTGFPNLPGADLPEDSRDALREHFFPPPYEHTVNTIYQEFNACPPVTCEEVSRVLARSSPSSAPGLDTIPYLVWKKLHSLLLNLLLELVNPLIQRGYHPMSLKKAEGVVLDKPGKPSYDTPTAYRIIILLETLSKIVERIVTNRVAA